MKHKFLFLSLQFSFLALTEFSHAQTLERYRKLKDTVIISQSLGYKKRAEIIVPAEYQSDVKQNFPLIIIFDKQNQRNYKLMLSAIDYLTSTEQMPSSLIIGIDAGPGAKRYLETQLRLSDTSGLGEKNEDFIFKELIPMARNEFKASPFTALIGHSRYGYFTTYLLTRHVRDLNAVIALSPFLEQKNINLLDSLIAATAATQLRHHVYFRYGVGNDYPLVWKSLQTAARSGKFKNNNFNITGWSFPQADHMATPGLSIGQSLYEIFEPWLSLQNQYVHSTIIELSSTSMFDKAVTEHYGTSLPFSIGSLNGKGWSYFNQKNYKAAIICWQQLVNQYPNFAEGYLNIAKAQQQLHLSIVDTIRRFKASLASSVIWNEKQKEGLLGEALALDGNKY